MPRFLNQVNYNDAYKSNKIIQCIKGTFMDSISIDICIMPGHLLLFVSVLFLDKISLKIGNIGKIFYLKAVRPSFKSKNVLNILFYKKNL